MVRTTMFLGIAFTEALALIGFVVFILLEVRLSRRAVLSVYRARELTC